MKSEVWRRRLAGVFPPITIGAVTTRTNTKHKPLRRFQAYSGLYFLNRLNIETHSRINMTQHSTHDDLGHRNLLLKLENLLELAPLENLEAKDENVVVLQTEKFNVQQLAKLN